MNIRLFLAGLGGLVILNGCLAGAAVNVVGETVETGIELTGATAKATGQVVGGTVDAVIPGDQSGRKKKDRD